MLEIDFLSRNELERKYVGTPIECVTGLLPTERSRNRASVPINLHEERAALVPLGNFSCPTPVSLSALENDCDWLPYFLSTVVVQRIYQLLLLKFWILRGKKTIAKNAGTCTVVTDLWLGRRTWVSIEIRSIIHKNTYTSFVNSENTKVELPNLIEKWRVMARGRSLDIYRSLCKMYDDQMNCRIAYNATENYINIFPHTSVLRSLDFWYSEELPESPWGRKVEGTGWDLKSQRIVRHASLTDFFSFE